MTGSPSISIFETVASAGKRLPSRRSNSTSKRSVATGLGFSIISRRRWSWRSRCSGGVISERIGTPTASEALQPKSRSAALFQAVITPSRSSVMKASGAPSSTRRVRASLS